LLTSVSKVSALPLEFEGYESPCELSSEQSAIVQTEELL